MSFGGGYKLDGFALHVAHRPQTLDESKLKCTRRSKPKPSRANKNNAKVLTADIILPKATNFNDTVPLEKFSIILRIDALNEF